MSKEVTEKQLQDHMENGVGVLDAMDPLVKQLENSRMYSAVDALRYLAMANIVSLDLTSKYFSEIPEAKKIAIRAIHLALRIHGQRHKLRPVLDRKTENQMVENDLLLQLRLDQLKEEK